MFYHTKLIKHILISSCCPFNDLFFLKLFNDLCDCIKCQLDLFFGSRISDVPEIMRQMPALPVKLNEDLANSMLPRPPGT
jgi:hypothetical protein